MRKKLTSIALVLGIILSVLTFLPANNFAYAENLNLLSAPILNGTDSLSDSSKIADCIDGEIGALEFNPGNAQGPAGGKQDQVMMLSSTYPWATTNGLLTSNSNKPYAIWKVDESSTVDVLAYFYSLGNIQLSYSKDGESYTDFSLIKVKKVLIDSQEKVVQYNLADEMDYGTQYFSTNYYSVIMPSNNGEPVYIKVTINSNLTYSTALSMVRATNVTLPVLNGTDSLSSVNNIVDCIDGDIGALEFNPANAQGPTGGKQDQVMMLSSTYPWATTNGLLTSNGNKPYAVWRVNESSTVEVLAYFYSLGNMQLSYSKDGENYTDFSPIKVKKILIDSQEKVAQYNLADEMDYGTQYFSTNYYRVIMPLNNGNPVYVKITINSDHTYSTALSMVRATNVALPVLNGTDSLSNGNNIVDCINGDIGAIEFNPANVQGPASGKQDQVMMLSSTYPWATTNGLLTSNGNKPYTVWRVNEVSTVEVLAYFYNLGNIQLSYSKDGESYTNFSPIKIKKVLIDSQEKVVQYNLADEMDYGTLYFSTNYYRVIMPSNGGKPVYLKITLSSDRNYSTALSMVRATNVALPVLNGTDSLSNGNNVIDCINGDIGELEFNSGNAQGPSGGKQDQVMMLTSAFPWEITNGLLTFNGNKPYAVWRVKDSSYFDVLAYLNVFDQAGISLSYSKDGEDYTDFTSNLVINTIIDNQAKVVQYNLANEMDYGAQWFTSAYYSVLVPSNNGNPVYIKITFDSQHTYSTALSMVRANDKMNSATLHINRINNIVSSISPETQVTVFKSELSAATGTIKVVDQSGVEVTSGFVGTGMRVQLINGTEVSDLLTIVIYGDVYGNGIIDLNDLVAIRDYLLEVDQLDDIFILAGDLYEEGDITLNDLVGMMDHISNNTTINQNR